MAKSDKLEFIERYAFRSGKEQGLTLHEAYTGKDATTHEALMPSAEDRQRRLARLTVNLVIEASVQVCLEKEVGLDALIQSGLLHVPHGMTLQQMKTQLDKQEGGRAKANWLAAHEAFLTVESVPNYEKTEERYFKAMAQYEKHHHKPTSKTLGALEERPTPPPPLWSHILESPYIAPFFAGVVVPLQKNRKSAEESRVRESTDPRMKGIRAAREAQTLPCGTLQDINRLSVLPVSPEMEALFFDRLNFHHRQVADVNPEEDRDDFFRSPRKVNANGRQDRKVYIALTEGVTEAAKARGVYGTIAEVAILSPHMYQANMTTHTIYEAQRQLELGDNGDMTVNTDVSEDVLQSINVRLANWKRACAAHIKLSATLTDAQKTMFEDSIGLSVNPFRTYYESAGNTIPITPEEQKMQRDEALMEARAQLSQLQRVHHVLAAIEAQPWRAAYVEDARAYNDTCRQVPEEKRIAQPIPDTMLAVVAGQNLQQTAKKPVSRTV